MLSAEENRLLTQVGPGTPMGELMRRYWHPIGAAAELDDNPVKQVRLMGEDLVLYRDRSGTLGLIDLHCPHRRADLSYGTIEDCGLRCNYHGWAFDESGACIDQPYEETAHPEAKFKERTTIKSYPVGVAGGMVWAYLGPAPAPCLPDWDVYHDRGFKQIVISEIPCNWLQCQENSIDPVHFEWLHSNWSLAKRDKLNIYDPSPTHTKIAFDEFEYGFVYRRVRADTDEDDELWTVGRVCLWPNALYTGHFEWRVPIDDENTLSVAWFVDPVPGDAPFEQERIPYWYSPIKDEKTGRWISSHTMQQDFIAWVGQGTIADRTQEHLGESDRGIIMIRRRFLDDVKLIADGGEPKGLLRDESANNEVYLPRTNRRTGTPSRPVGADGYPVSTATRLLYGEPTSVREEMKQAWEQMAQPAGD